MPTRRAILRIAAALAIAIPIGVGTGSPTLATTTLHPLPWRSLEFAASDWLNDISLKARWQPLAPKPAREALVEIPDRAAIEPGGSGVALLEAVVEATSRFSGKPKRWGGEIWYRSGDGVALQRIRSKLTGRTTRKVYRYAPDGVFRVREEASKRRERFLPFADAAGCDAVSDPALLLVLASSLEPRSERRVCMFNKKGIYEVALRSGIARPHGVRFQQVGDEGAPRAASVERSVRIEIEVQPLGDAAEHEAFEFFELQPPLAISVDPKSRLPVAIEGSIPGAGTVSFELREVAASR